MSQGAQEFERVLESDPKHCADLVRELLDLLEVAGWSNDEMFSIRMAVEEAVMNAIKHGNDEDRDKNVHVLIRLEKDRFYTKISDQGKGFCPDEVPDPTKEANLEKTSGRGVMLMKTFVDECRYNKCGNSVELVKHRS
ncbi:ATP-binding protein [Mariniblastus fucicola]|uniref:Serine-protein kinase RsbW n=1 Tax=Mariniblastus fucicola TaxID=980251 RepID=A0A5B9P5T7_9BACT|nr:ATP-binding protein [Mariniblastus fucicola]QEG20869.1 Serine-protein kinase RsbW [Mariniblastus fucicola]